MGTVLKARSCCPACATGTMAGTQHVCTRCATRLSREALAPQERDYLCNWLSARLDERGRVLDAYASESRLIRRRVTKAKRLKLAIGPDHTVPALAFRVRLARAIAAAIEIGPLGPSSGPPVAREGAGDTSISSPVDHSRYPCSPDLSLSGAP